MQGSSSALLLLPLIFVACDHSPTDPPPVEPVPVQLALSVYDQQADGFDRALWRLRSSTGLIVAVGSFKGDTVVDLRLVADQYLLEWRELYAGEGGLQWRLAPIDSLEVLDVDARTTFAASTDYRIMTSAIRVRATGLPATGSVFWSLLNANGECVRCFEVITASETTTVDLIPIGVYTIEWSAYRHDLQPHFFWFSPHPGRQTFELRSNFHVVELASNYVQQAGSVEYRLRGIPAGAAVPLALADESGQRAMTGVIHAPLDIVTPVLFATWNQRWSAVIIDGVTYAPAETRTSFTVTPGLAPHVAEMTYNAQ